MVTKYTTNVCPYSVLYPTLTQSQTKVSQLAMYCINATTVQKQVRNGYQSHEQDDAHTQNGRSVSQDVFENEHKTCETQKKILMSLIWLLTASYQKVKVKKHEL